MHRNAGEDAVAPLRQHSHDDAHRAIADRHQHRRGDQPQHPVRRLDRSRARAVQRIDRPFEGERHRQRRELGEQQQHHRPDHAHLQIGAIARPDVGPEMNQGPDQRALLGGRRRGRGLSASGHPLLRRHHQDPALAVMARRRAATSFPRFAIVPVI
ncbi:hypothetical protein chiPu_0029851 [Chiloscyllium punctatum]|uniref:Uncharacterized protein n=1 Tax=Chiloscyllium punctatum TaxID=137246 RepID=A0A401TS75_CHIPU|nr:hypothetical protein [Chiloscyllium punctatum]